MLRAAATTAFILTTACPALSDTLNVPAEFPTVESALSSATDGDTVLVAAGTYFEHGLSCFGKAITLEGDVDSEGLPAVTLDSQGLDSVLILSSNEGQDTIIRNIAFTGSTEQAPGTAVVLFHSRPTFINCTFRDNTSSIGGGVYNLNGAPRFFDCRFLNNTATWGGGYACWETGQPDHPVFMGCHFSGNTATLGGGMANLASRPVITACTFTNNTATNNGGGLYNQGTDCCPEWAGSPEIESCLFEGNHAAQSGGAIFNDLFGEPVINNSTIRNNSAEQDGSAIASIIDNIPAIGMTMLCGNNGTSTQISGSWINQGNNSIEDICPIECIGDFDGNGSVDVNDLLILLAAYQINNDGDCDGDADTDVDDVLILIQNWGICD